MYARDTLIRWGYYEIVSSVPKRISGVDLTKSYTFSLNRDFCVYRNSTVAVIGYQADRLGRTPKEETHAICQDRELSNSVKAATCVHQRGPHHEASPETPNCSYGYEGKILK